MTPKKESKIGQNNPQNRRSLGFSTASKQLLENIQDTDKDSLENGRKLLQSLVNEINVRYGTKLGIDDVCKLIRENINIFPLDKREALMQAAEIFSDPILYKCDTLCARFYWPTEWNWFGLNHHPSKSHLAKKMAKANGLENYGTERDLLLEPHLAVGFASMLAGGLIFLLPIPGAQGLGGGLLAIGGGMILEGIAQGEKGYYFDSKNNRAVP